MDDTGNFIFTLTATLAVTMTLVYLERNLKQFSFLF